jgi:murein DD-endopeptidase MepM/ murein hydrolase activator NlpD
MKLFRIVFLSIVVSLALIFFILYSYNLSQEARKKERNIEGETQKKVEITYTKSFEVTKDSTFGKLMAQASTSPAVSQAIFNASKDIYNLTNIRLGRTVDLVYDKESDELKQLIYQIDSEEKLYVTLSPATTTAANTEKNWLAEKKIIPYEIKIRTAEGEIETSMWESGLAQNIDERAIIAFADVFQWSVDFAWEVRKGDQYKFIYEERYLDGEYVMPGKILAGKFTNEGKNLYSFYYKESEEKEGYFDQEGNSVQKVFLKTPVAFKYISSGFTTGLRYVKAFNVSTGHRAIDYAASYGSPVRSVGDGTAVFAGWAGAYGNKLTIRHNSTYSTNYCHLSKFAVRYGQVVTQGQTIGYIGSTGFSTGPHLHYEMVKNGTKINPLTEEFPAAEGISEENKSAYLEAIKDWKVRLD